MENIMKKKNLNEEQIIQINMKNIYSQWIMIKNNIKKMEKENLNTLNRVNLIIGQ